MNKRIVTFVALAVVVLVTLAAVSLSIPRVSAGGRWRWVQVRYTASEPLRIMKDNSFLLVSEEGSFSFIGIQFRRPIRLEEIKEWELKFTCIPKSGSNPYGGTDVPYFTILVGSRTEIDAIIHATGTWISLDSIGEEVEVIQNPCPNPPPGSTGDYQSPGWVLAFGDLEEYGFPPELGRGGYPGVTLPELIDMMLAAKRRIYVHEIRVQVEFADYNDNTSSYILFESVTIGPYPMFPNDDSVITTQLKPTVTKWLYVKVLA